MGYAVELYVDHAARRSSNPHRYSRTIHPPAGSKEELLTGYLEKVTHGDMKPCHADIEKPCAVDNREKTEDSSQIQRAQLSDAADQA